MVRPPPGPGLRSGLRPAPARGPAFRRGLATALILPLFASAAPVPPPGLEERIAAILERPELSGSTFGILVTHLPSGEVLYAYRPQALLPPASTAKLVTCAGVLALLGEDFRFETPLVRTGPLEAGVVQGDLVLIASGDPNLSQRVSRPGGAGDGALRFADRDHSYAGFSDADLVPGDPLAVLKELARQVRAAEVREVLGDLIVDDGLFQETEDSFVGPFSAACVNDNLVDIVVAPGDRPGEPARVTYQPRVSSVRVNSFVETVEAGTAPAVSVRAAEGVASFEVHGKIPLGHEPLVRVGRLADPALAAAHFLGDVLADEGVAVRGQRRRGRFGPAVYREYPAVARHLSPPLSETIRVTLKVSQNLHATMLPVVAGALRGGRGDRRAGFAAMAEIFALHGLPVERVILQSGSGGGAADRLSPEFLVGLLDHMRRRPDFGAFFDALPVGGVDGTLAERFRSPELRGRVRAKTGTLVYRGTFNERWIYLAKALAGYLDLRQPERPEDLLGFAILIANTVTSSRKQGANDLFHAQEDILAQAASAWRERVATAAGR